MAKVKLELGAELDLLNRDELAAELSESGKWQRQAAMGLRHIDLPIMSGKVSGAAITLGADQTDGSFVGPQSGFYWKVTRVSVEGLAANDQVKLYKGGSGLGVGRFVAWIAFQPGVYTPGSQGLILKPGDTLAISGTGLAATGEIRVTGEAITVPGPLMWKLL